MNKSICVKDIKISQDDNETCLTAMVDDDCGGSDKIYFKSNELVNLPVNIGDPYLCSMLMPSMKQGGKLIIDAPVSKTLFNVASSIIQDIYLRWDKSLKRVEIEAQVLDDVPSIGAGKASFFSGGLDSLYTLHKHKAEVTHTAFVWGFEISLKERDLWNGSREYLDDAAKRYEKIPVYIETNLKAWSDRRVDWGMYHGGALAAIGYFISADIDKVYIGSSHTYEHLFPWGSHPLLDPLWSSTTLKFFHDGCEATRIVKSEAISDDQIALDIIRVCYKNPNGAYNCGKCDKCLRTMMNLQAVGVLEKCKTLPHELDYKKIASSEILNESALSFFEENRDAAEKNHQDKLVAALNKAISRKGKRHFKTILRTKVVTPMWDNMPSGLKSIIRVVLKRA